MENFDTFLTVIISTICFYVVFNKMSLFLLQKKHNQQVNSRISNVKKQEAIISNTMNKRFSTFQKQEREKIEDMFGTQKGKLEKLKAKLLLADMNPSIFMFFIYCLIAGILSSITLIYFEFCEIIIGIPAGLLLGYFIMINYVSLIVSRKKSAFTALFPDAIDMMIRGVRAGLNISRIIKLVSMESKPPISTIFTSISRKMELGIKTEKILAEKAEELDVEEFRFLSVALILQLENGGGLVEILTNLSNIVRKRLELHLKMKAMSAEARMSAIVLCSLPFAFAGIMMALDPDHISAFFKPGTGQTLLKVFIVLFILGVVLMLKATKIKV